MAKGRLGAAAARRIGIGAFVFVGAFLFFFGLGSKNIAFVVAGALVAALALGARISASLRPRPRQWVLGTGRVAVVSDEPPATGDYGRCELQLTVDAPGMPAETVVVRDPRVPVDEWPYPGLVLPIEVAADNVRNVRVLWRGRLETDPPWQDELDVVDDQPEPSPRQPPGSHLDPPEDDLIDFDLDEMAVTGVELGAPDEGRVRRPTAAAEEPRRFPSPRPRPREATPVATLVPAATEPVTAVTPVTPVTPEAAGPAPEPPVPREEAVRPQEDVPPGEAVLLEEVVATSPSAHPGPTAAIHGVGVTVLVADLTRSVAFYRDQLGFHEVDGGDDTSVLASGGTRLVLRSTQELGKVNRRLVHLNLEVADIDTVYDELRANGVRFTYPPRIVNRSTRLEQWAAAFRDPDGHGIALTQWRTPAPSPN